VSRFKASRLVAVGLLLMAAARLYHNWMPDRFPDFFFGTSMGVSIGLMLVGLWRSRRQANRSEESGRPCD
jgi:hypothetical protein